MTTADAILILLIAAFIGWIAWEIRRAPVCPMERSEYADDTEAAEQCIEASRPVPLTNHVRAGTAYGKAIK